MSTILKWLGRIVVGLVVLVTIGAALIYVRSDSFSARSG
jgi:hypothetical protein